MQNDAFFFFARPTGRFHADDRGKQERADIYQLERKISDKVILARSSE
jgi:hypothetical protein